MRRCFTWIVLVSLAALLLVACSGENQAYTDACTADTAESYRGYIEQFPDGMHIADVRHRLDLKDYNAAEKENTATAFEKYVADHPEGKYADNAIDKAKNLAWDEAEKANTVDAMVAFKEKYGTGAFGLKCETRLEALRYAATSVKFEEMVVERVNVGGDRRADPDGWAVRTKVINSGERSCKVMKIRIVFLDAGGQQVDQKIEFVATPSHPMGIPIPERLMLPFEPGGERDFEYLIGDPNVNKAWQADVEHVRIEVTEIDFVEG